MQIELEFSTAQFLDTARRFTWVTPENAPLVTRAAFDCVGPVGVDTEFHAPGMLLHGVRPDLVQIALPDGAGYCTTFLCRGADAHLLGELLSSRKPKVMHMANVDRTVLRNVGIETPNTQCTYSLARRFTTQDDLSLKGLTGEYLGIRLAKFSQFKGKTPAQLVNENDPTFLEYAALDPALTVLLYRRIADGLERQR